METETAMRSADAWFAEYGESHQNATNKLIHWICVPAIFFSILGLFYTIPFPSIGPPWLGWDVVVTVLGLLFYLRLSISLFIGFLIYTLVNLYLIRWIALQTTNTLWWFVGIFIVAWIGQFIGHKIEGKKPSFFKDIQFLMIGPAWLMSFVYKRLGVSY